MSTATTISINDATPTAHAFDPSGRTQTGAVMYYNNADASTSATAESVGISLSRANGSRSVNKGKVSLAIPYEKTVDGVVLPRSTFRMNVTFDMPDDMTSAERLDAYALSKNLLAHADVQALVEDNEPTW